jgi:hypothetical protein
MHANSNTETSSETTPPLNPPFCPICNALLIPLRGCYRCSRCLITLCLGCEASHEGGAGGGE